MTFVFKLPTAADTILFGPIALGSDESCQLICHFSGEVDLFINGVEQVTDQFAVLRAKQFDAFVIVRGADVIERSQVFLDFRQMRVAVLQKRRISFSRDPVDPDILFPASRAHDLHQDAAVKDRVGFGV